MVFALAGDSTITRFFDIVLLFVKFRAQNYIKIANYTLLYKKKNVISPNYALLKPSFCTA